jgi:hypothetical protein
VAQPPGTKRALFLPQACNSRKPAHAILKAKSTGIFRFTVENRQLRSPGRPRWGWADEGVYPYALAADAECIFIPFGGPQAHGTLKTTSPGGRTEKTI